MKASPRVGVTKRVSLLLVAMAATLALFPATAGAEVPELLAKVPEDDKSGFGAGHISFPSGIAIDPNLPGNVYVLDSGNSRIDVFSPWGEFLKAFGWHVNAANPEEKLQACTFATECLEGSEGGGAGQFDQAEAIAVDSEGNVYVAEGGFISNEKGSIGNRRVQKFGPEGEFLAAFGGDTIAHGPDDSTNDEVQELSLAASEGTFKLSFEHPYKGGETKETAALPFNASAATVKTALNGLATIGGLGGSVSVTGGPGDATGSSPYIIVFEGNLGGDDVPQLTVDRSALGPASIGATLRCSTETEAETIEYRWLRNGVEIPSAESPSYATVAADEGKSVQCQVTAKIGEGASVQAATPVYVAPPEGGTPPVAPLANDGGLGEFTATSDAGNLTVGGPGGGKLTCEKGNWIGATSFSYRWYRNGQQIPGATESTYVATEKDVASPAYFQCAVTASNASTATTTEFSGRGQGSLPFTFPQPNEPNRPSPPPFPRVEMKPPSNVFTSHTGGETEVCGGADTCKAGVQGVENGYLGAGRYESKITASPLDGAVFVGEAENGETGEAAKVQIFDPDGSFREEITLPEEEGVTFGSIAAGPDGNLYASFQKRTGESDKREGEVRKLKPSGPSTEFLQPKFTVSSFESENLISPAVDSAGNLYAIGTGTSRNFGEKPPAVFVFDSSGKCLDCGTQGEEGEPGFDRSPIVFEGSFSPDVINGIAFGSACDSIDIYTVHRRGGKAFFKIFGPPPSPALCPPPEVPPTIASQYAVSVDTSSAELHARINPHFWPDTAYFVEYGTSPCSEGGCELTRPAPPGQRLTPKTTNAQLTSPAIFLTGLEPGTTYHYRFVAESGGGGPIWGIDPEGPGGASEEDGLEGTFTTARLGEAEACPQNEAFRGGPSALLPDCRAYEMVSPLEKEGADVYALRDISGFNGALSQSSPDGSRVSYGAYRAFGDAKAGPLTSQYVAARGEDGWHSHYILGPRERMNGSAFAAAFSEPELAALSSDLCEGWIETVAEPPLAPAALPEQLNLYRRHDQECGEESYEALTTVPPPHGYTEPLKMQGVSADGTRTLYITGDNLTPDAPNLGGDGFGLYYQVEGEGPPHYVCILPSGAPITTVCTAGTTDSGYWSISGRESSLTGAISADGSRVFWTLTKGTGAKQASQGPGPIYLRFNPDQTESAHLHGTAAGTGNLIGAAAGTGNLINGSKNISAVTETSGHFAVGQVVSGPGIPAGDKIVTIAVELSGKLKLTLEKAAGSGATTGAEIIGAGSATVTNLTTKAGAFAVGQEVFTPSGGAPPGATITACAPSCGPAATSLTLSAPAAETVVGATLQAAGKCLEAETKGCTIPVSAEGEALSGATRAQFWAASTDGSRVLFTTGAGKGDLYEFNVDDETTTLIAKKTFGVMGASEDASRVYFGSEEVLTAEPNPEGDLPQAGKVNVYLAESGSYRFVATLAGTEDPNGYYRPIDPNSVNRSSRVSPDGLHAAFASTASPTGYDNTDAKSPGRCGEPEGRCDIEVFFYDASADGGQGKLVCASCNPSGARPAGYLRSVAVQSYWAASWLPAWKTSLYAGRVISDDGTRLYFESIDRLSPRDSNGTIDVYQWEAPGAGSCDEGDPAYSDQNGGCVSLISSGQGTNDAEFLDASPSGDDVFFTTVASLLEEDYGLTDVYDARVNGGLPPPAKLAPECEGEACQGTPEPPNDPTPASESFQGAGNVREEAAVPVRKPCAKGKVRRKGKCVTRKHKKAHRRAKHARRAGR